MANFWNIEDTRTMKEFCFDAFNGLISDCYSIHQKYNDKNRDFPTTIRDNTNENKGLIVMVHGRNSHPSQFGSYLTQLSTYYPEWSIFMPIVLDKGNASLDDSVIVLLPEILDWINKNPGLPVILIGTSMGGKIILELSNLLPNTIPVLVISLAGAIGGSGLLTLGESLGLAKFLVNETLRNEMVYDSDRNKQLLTTSKTRANEGNIWYVFLGTTDDPLLVDPSMAFPNVSDDSLNILFKGFGHSGIVNNSLNIVLELLNKWYDTKTFDISFENYPEILSRK
jgi:pimeloyl-ACP methyl ester carboxylesterase